LKKGGVQKLNIFEEVTSPELLIAFYYSPDKE